MSKILGIDLGTTNSAMAVLEGGTPTTIVNAEGDRTTPAGGGFRADGDRIVGKAAKNQAVTNTKNEVFTPEQIMGMTLAKMQADPDKYLGETISEAVITVPAYFNDAQREAIQDGGSTRRLAVQELVKDTTG